VTAGSSTRGLSRRKLQRTVSRYRRQLAGILAAAAVTSGLAAVSPAPASSRAVVVAAHDLAAGQVLAAGDVSLVNLPVAARPEGALGDVAGVAGRSVAGPVRRGEPITDVRLVGAGLLRGSKGLVAAPVRLVDAAAVALVRPGDLVDILAAAGIDPAGVPASEVGPARLVAGQARVLAVPGRPDSASSDDGALLLVAVTPQTARDLAAAAAGERLSLVILG
jgi:pilus assembly protein CpaB